MTNFSFGPRVFRANQFCLYLYLYSAGPVTALNAPERERECLMFQN